MERLRFLGRNLLRVTSLEFLWGLRVRENLVYNFLIPSMILVLLGLIRRGDGYLLILVPGMVALISASSAMQGVAVPVSFMRIYGSWKTIQASPVPTWLYLAGLTFSRLLRTAMIVSFMLVTAVVVLGYEIPGSVLLAVGWSFFGGATFAALGLAISFFVPSPQAVSGTLSVVLLPMIFASNVFYRVDLEWLKAVSQVLPLTYLVNLVRGSLNETPTFQDLLPNVAVLATWLVVCSCLALFLAKRRSEEK